LNRRGPARSGWKAWGNEAQDAADTGERAPEPDYDVVELPKFLPNRHPIPADISVPSPQGPELRQWMDSMGYEE